MTSENRIDIHTSSYGVYIDSPPYKSIKYGLMFIVYMIIVGLFILGVIYRDIIFFENRFSAMTQTFFVIFLGGSMFMFAINGLPLFFSVIKNSFYKNFFLIEHLSIEKGKIKYSNSFGKKISYNLSHIKWIYFEFNKPYGEFSGVPLLIPNYTPTIYFRDENYNNIAQIMFSVKESEIEDIYKVILDYLLTEKHFYQKRDVEYKDEISHIKHWGKEIKLISVYQFFEMHMDKFSNEERSYYYKLAEQQAASENELSNALLSKIKDSYSR